MQIKEIFTSDIAVKIFYAYLAISLGNTGLEVADKVKPDVVADRMLQMEKRFDRMESLIIDLIREKKS